MKTMQSLHLLALLAASANAFPGGSFTFYGMSGCNGDSSFQFKEAYPTSNVQCTSHYFESQGFKEVSGDSKQYVAWFDGANLPTSCTFAVLSQASAENDGCGPAIDIIKGGTAECIQTKLPKDGGFALCCDGKGGCSSVPMAGKLRRNASLKTPSLKKTDGVLRNIADVKRSPFLNGLEKRSCGFTGSNIGKKTGEQQLVSDAISCPSGQSSSCSFSNMASITTGSSNTFGASESTTVGSDDLFADIQETVSFSYSYTYSKSKSVSQSYTIEVPPGETGYLSWTPTLSCASGSFPSSCGLPTSTGTACVPLYVSGDTGSLLGTFAFVQSQ